MWQMTKCNNAYLKHTLDRITTNTETLQYHVLNVPLSGCIDNNCHTFNRFANSLDAVLKNTLRPKTRSSN